MNSCVVRRALVAFSALGVLAAPLTAQETVSPEDVWLSGIGLSLHGAMISHTGDFTLPGAPTCCVGYTDASSFGLSVGAFFRQEITKHARLTLRGSYMPYDGTFATNESLLLSGQIPGVVKHELEARMGVFAGEALVDIRLPARIRVMGGLSFGSFISSTYSQSETLVEPVAGTFENGRRVRNEQNNVEMQGLAGSVMGIVGGVGLDLPLTVNHSVVLTPEVLYTHPLGDNLANGSWTTSVIRAGVSLAFNLNAPAPPIPVERRRETFVDSLIVDIAPDAEYRRTTGDERVVVDTVKGEDLIVITERAYRTDTVYRPLLPTIDAAIAARAVMADGSVRNTFTINVSTQFVTEALPVLPVVFFDARDIALARRYHQVADPAQYDEAKIAPRTTDVHHEILNIIGKRLQDNAALTIRLRGHADPTTESGDCDMARKRAESIRTYLTTVWGIAADRIQNITASGNCAPEKLTRQQSEEGYSENRRVEIESDDLSILAPVGRRRFNEARAVDPPKLLFDPSGTSTKYVTSWKIEAKSGNTTLFSKDGQGVPTSVVQDLTTTQADMMKDGEPVTVELSVQAIRGVSKTASATLAVKRDTLATEFERLTLTLFDVASDKVTPVAEEQIRRFVEVVPAGSIVSVRGFADMLGNATFNRELSQRRATAVCATIQRYLKKRVTLKCDEVRTDRFPPGIESYMTPEERFLSRTVQIEVKRSR
jgi:outer membrane protein OmpA-like peptidoglycan-associated protein